MTRGKERKWLRRDYRRGWNNRMYEIEAR